MIIIKKIVDEETMVQYEVKNPDEKTMCNVIIRRTDGNLYACIERHGETVDYTSNKLSGCSFDILVGENSVEFNFIKLTKRGKENRLTLIIKINELDFDIETWF